MIETAVGAASGGACAAGAIVLYVSERLPGLNKATGKLHTDRTQALLIMTASASLVATPAGGWWNHTINGINDWATGLVGDWTGLAVTALPALIAVPVFINDLITRRVEHRTRIVAAVLPVLAATIPGPVGHGIQSGLGWVITTIGQLVGSAFGAS